jgi:error-prone DNA polymerase
MVLWLVSTIDVLRTSHTIGVQFSHLRLAATEADQPLRQLGINAVALIDRDTVAGAVRFHFEARECGIKPIIGSEITLEDRSVLPLVPIDLSGYQNLSKLITSIKLRNKKGEHFATRKDIEDHSEGLLCFTGGATVFSTTVSKIDAASLILRG